MCKKFQSKKIYNFSKKAISPVIATALLLVVAVGSVTMFDSWFQEFSSHTYSNVETKTNNEDKFKIDGVFGNILYLRSPNNDNLSVLKVKDENGKVMCDFSGGAEVNSTGLVGWWTFDEIINNSGTLILPDYSRFGNDGVLYGQNTPNLINSKLGKALEFDGVDDWINIINFNLTINNSIIAISKLYNNLNYGYSIFALNENKELLGYWNKKSHMRLSPNDNSTLYGNEYDINQNLFIALTIKDNLNNRSIKLFQEGKLINYSLVNETLIYQNLNYSIGMEIDTWAGIKYKTDFLNGQIDEIRIYNRTLSDQEIKTLYWYSIKPLKEGLNQIDLSSCNLNSNNIYSIFTITESGKNLNYNFVPK